MTSILVDFAMFPTDKGESVSPYVSQVIKIIKESGYDYTLTPMSTIIEVKNIDDALEVIKKCYQKLDELGCDRVYSVLKFDIRKNHKNRMESKIKSIEDKIGKVNRVK